MANVWNSYFFSWNSLILGVSPFKNQMLLTVGVEIIRLEQGGKIDNWKEKKT